MVKSSFLDMGVKSIGFGTGGQRIDQLARKIKDFRPVFRAIRPTVQQVYADKFKAQGPGWKKHASNTIIMHGQHSILNLSGRLERSMSKKAKGSHSRTYRKRMVHGTTLKYATYVGRGFTQQVTSKMKGFLGARGVNVGLNSTLKVPRRNFERISKKDERRIRDHAEKVMRMLVKKI